MNAALARAVLRQPPPAIVPYLIEAIDRCDPTRSRELKPSARMRNRAADRRLIRAAVFCLLGSVALLACVAFLS